MSRQRHIYIAGPLSTGDVFANTNRAISAATELVGAGLVPFVPHLCALWAIVRPGISYETWMEQDFAWLRRCDALLRLPGESRGADREVALAGELGLPVFTEVEAVLRWAGVEQEYRHG